MGLGKWAKSQALMLYSEEHDTPWVHKGFADAYNSVRDRVLQLIKVRWHPTHGRYVAEVFSAAARLGNESLCDGVLVCS